MKKIKKAAIFLLSLAMVLSLMSGIVLANEPGDPAEVAAQTEIEDNDNAAAEDLTLEDAVIAESSGDEDAAPVAGGEDVQAPAAGGEDVQAPESDPEIEDESLEIEQEANPVIGGDNDEMLMEYLEVSATASNDATYATYGYNHLPQGINQTVYLLFKDRIQEVAEGTETSTAFTLSMADIGLDGKYTAADLGVDAVVSGGAITQQAKDALQAKIQEISLSRVLTALLFDLPAELYWYDKTVGTVMNSTIGIGAEQNGQGEWAVFFADGASLTYSFTVAEDFAVNNASGTYVVDPAKIAVIQTVAAETEAILDRHANESDYQKVTSYKNEICEAVDYNTDAGKGSYAYSYGNPWQIIWVFDGDENTKVVCEGYSKAFQFLCDCSEFRSDKTASRMVTGTMSGGTGAGRHMWNVITMNDGENYLVDVTNCDTGTIGAPDKLFLKGDPDGTASGYTVSSVTYSYDNDTKNSYSESELKLATANYDPGAVTGTTVGDIAFAGDDESYSHPYLVDGVNATLSLDDLAITVLDEEGSVIDPSKYTLAIYQTWYDPDEEKDVYVEVTAPFGIADKDKEEGFTEYEARAKAKDGSGYEGEATGRFFIQDQYCLNYTCCDCRFDPEYRRGNNRSWHDYYQIPLGCIKAPYVGRNDSTPLQEGTDYKITYFERDDSVLDGDYTEAEEKIRYSEEKPLAGLPTEPGTYFLKVEGLDPYYGATYIDFDIVEFELILEGFNYELQPGENCSVKAKVIGYNKDGSPYEVQDALFRWYYDDSALRITDKNGNFVGSRVGDQHYDQASYGFDVPFTVSRQSSDEAEIVLLATEGDAEGAKEYGTLSLWLNDNYQFHPSVEFLDNNNIVFSDQKTAVFYYDFNEGCEGLDLDKLHNYNIDLNFWNFDKYGYDNPEAERQHFTEGTHFTTSYNKEKNRVEVTMDLEKMFARMAEEDYETDVIGIYATVTDKETGAVVAQPSMGGIFVQDPSYAPVFEDFEMLPGWGRTFDGTCECWVRNADVPEGRDATFEITDMKVTSGADIVSVRKEGEGDDSRWELQASEYAFGDATVEVSLKDQDTQKEQKESFEVHVVGDIFEVSVESDNGSTKALPGDTRDFTATVMQHHYDKDPDKRFDRDVTDEMTFTWKLWDSGSYYADLTPNGNKATLKVKDSSLLEFRRGFSIEATAAKDGEAVGSGEIWFEVENQYTELWPTQIKELKPGQTITVKVEERLYSSKADNYTPVENVKFEWDYDKTEFIITDEGNSQYKITRLALWDCRLWLHAEWDDPYDAGQHFEDAREYNFEGLEVRFVEPETHNIYDDGDLILEVDEEPIKEVMGDDYEIVFRGGIDYNEEDDTYPAELIKGVDFDVDGNKIILHGDKIYKSLNEPYEIKVDAGLMINGTEVWGGSTWVYLTNAIVDYNGIEEGYPQYHQIMPGQFGNVAIENWAYVENTEHPYGEEVPYYVTNVTVKEDPKGLIKSLEKNGNLSFHYETNEVFATATLEATYIDLNGQEKKGLVIVQTVSDIYHVDIHSADNRFQGFPGVSFRLFADVEHIHYDAKTGKTENLPVDDLEVKWAFVDEESKEYATLTPDSEEPFTEILRFNSLEGEEAKDPGFHRTIRVCADLYEKGGTQSLTGSDISMDMSNRYQQLEPDVYFAEDAPIPFGKEYTLTTEARDYCVNYPDFQYKTMQNMNFRINFSEEDLEVRKADGTLVKNGGLLAEDAELCTFSIKGLKGKDTGDGTVFELIGEGDLDGHPIQIRRSYWVGLYEAADYSEVEQLLDQVEELDLTKYTADSLKALDEAVAAVEWDLPIERQDDVDAMADAIQDAIDNLKVITYTIKWVNYDGRVLETDTVEIGTLPEYNGKTPTRPSTAQYTYTFDKWSPEVVPAAADATYTATYKETKNKYKITWFDEDGKTVLRTDEVKYGEEPSYGKDPTKAPDEYGAYVFVGWNPKVQEVTGDASYIAVFELDAVFDDLPEGYVGLAQARNGKWYYVKDGKVEFTYNGVAKNSYGWWKVTNGVVDMSFNGFAANENGTWFLSNGKVDFDYTGFAAGTARGQEAWWYVEGGQVKFNKNDILSGTANNDAKKAGVSGWWLVRGSKVVNETTVDKNANGWWYIEAGKVNFTYNGFARNANGWWFVENGKVTFNRTDMIYGTANIDPADEGVLARWYVKESKVTKATGVLKGGNGWWYVKDGKVDMSYTGIKDNEYGWWRIESGKVNFDYTGFALNEYGWWWLESGKVNFDKNDIIKGTANIGTSTPGLDGWWLVRGGKVVDETTVAKNAYGWWFVNRGRVDFNYTGVQDNSYGWWAIRNGAVDFNYRGFLNNEYGWWFLENGQVSFKKNDVIQGKANTNPNAKGVEGWWYVRGSKVLNETTVASNSNGWWYIRNGQVDFTYDGLGTNEYGTWYIVDGKVDFSYTGHYEFKGKDYYIVNGKVQE